MKRHVHVQVVIIALIMGTLWLQLDVTPENARQFFAVIFMSIMFIALNGFSQLQMIQQVKPVFFKQRDNLFYHGCAPSLRFSTCVGFGCFSLNFSGAKVASILRVHEHGPGPPVSVRRAANFALATFAATLPFTIVEASLFAAIVYFMVGFTPTASAFFTFLLILVVTAWAFAAFVRTISAAAPSVVVANAVRSSCTSAPHNVLVSEWVNVCCENIRDLQLLVSDPIPSL